MIFMDLELAMLKPDDRMIGRLAAINLALSATHKKVIKSVAPEIDPATLNQYHQPKHPRGWDHRYSEIWTKNQQSVLAVRAHRVFISLFAKNQNYDLPLRAIDLWDWYQTYAILYPHDEMTANRMHYMVQMIRSDKLRIKPCCSSCGQSFVVHQELWAYTSCPICRFVSNEAGIALPSGRATSALSNNGHNQTIIARSGTIRFVSGGNNCELRWSAGTIHISMGGMMVQLESPHVELEQRGYAVLVKLNQGMMTFETDEASAQQIEAVIRIMKPT